MDALTPVRLALRTRVTARGGFTAHEHLSTDPHRSPCFTSLNLPTVLSPITPAVLGVRFAFFSEAYRAQAVRKLQVPPFQWDGSSFGLRHCSAGSPRQKAESSSIPTDRSFASGCSQPRLTTRQLPSATVSKPDTERDFHPPDSSRLQAHRTGGLMPRRSPKGAGRNNSFNDIRLSPV